MTKTKERYGSKNIALTITAINLSSQRDPTVPEFGVNTNIDSAECPGEVMLDNSVPVTVSWKNLLKAKTQSLDVKQQQKYF